MKRAHFKNLLVGALALLMSMTTLASADDAKEAAIKKDHKLIEGTWRIKTLEVNGNKAGDADASKFTVVNGADGAWRLRSEGNEVAKGTSTIDPTQKPRTIDFMPTSGQDQGQTLLGIYELKKNTRKLCFAPAGRNRPTEFSSTAENQHILVTFERVKAE
ncbi:TIGR03067 domain-containing protein [Gimesia maris]|uniref:TIGR03067 domain-containing protein n=1 Tax=Gimesia maris TaxID=122 RepID=UPI0030D8D22F|tara:strand:- start:10662 stop:11141 length:480 start_codon:yes stop_codon:yes gene_type:complete